MAAKTQSLVERFLSDVRSRLTDIEFIAPVNVIEFASILPVVHRGHFAQVPVHLLYAEIEAPLSSLEKGADYAYGTLFQESAAKMASDIRSLGRERLVSFVPLRGDYNISITEDRLHLDARTRFDAERQTELYRLMVRVGTL